MTKQETLQKIIEKAVAGGWEPVYVAHIDKNHIPQVKEIDANSFIYSHDFLKAYFGEGKLEKSPQTHADIAAMRGWQHHGCQMLLSEDPLGYLAKYL